MAIANLDRAAASAGLRLLAAATAAGTPLTAEQKLAQKQWLDTLSTVKPTPAKVQENIEQKRRGYLANVAAAAGSSLYLESMYLYKVGLWDAVGAMLIGMALLKRGVLSAERSLRDYLLMALVGYGIGIPLGIWVVSIGPGTGSRPVHAGAASTRSPE